MEMYARVRRACMVEGMSIREAAREFGLHRDAVRKMLKCSGPSGYGGASLSDDRSWGRALVHHQRGTFLRPILDLDALETIGALEPRKKPLDAASLIPLVTSWPKFSE